MSPRLELVVTLGLYAALITIGTLSSAGLLLAIAWLVTGAWFVLKTNSRGVLADLSFVVTWPIYLLREKL